MKAKRLGLILAVGLLLVACGKKEEVAVIDTTSSWENFSLSECSNEDYATVQNDVKEFLIENSDFAVYVENHTGTNTVSYSTAGLTGDETKSNCLNSFMEHLLITTEGTEQQLANFSISIAEVQGAIATEEGEPPLPQRMITLSYDTRASAPTETTEPVPEAETTSDTPDATE